jgi:hypothetical protein
VKPASFGRAEDVHGSCAGECGRFVYGEHKAFRAARRAPKGKALFPPPSPDEYDPVCLDYDLCSSLHLERAL